MKIPRYTASQTNNVSMLEQRVDIMQSPQEAAAAAYAPYKAISSIADTAVETLNTYQTVKDEMDVADDKVTNAIEDGYYENALKQAKEEHQKKSLTDPDWTMDKYVEEVKAINEARKGGVEKLKSRKVKHHTQRLFEANKSMVEENALYDAAIIDANRIGIKLQTNYNAAIEEENFTFAQTLLDIGMDTTGGRQPIIGPEEGAKAQLNLNGLIKAKQFRDTADYVKGVYLNDPKEGMRIYRDVIEDPNLSSEDQTKLEADIIGAINHANKLIQFEETEQETAFQNAADKHVLAIQSESPDAFQSPQEAIDFYNSGGYGKDHAAFVRVQSVLSEMRVGFESQKKASEWLSMYNSGEPMEDIKGNREQLQAYILNATKDMSPEEASQFTMDAVNKAGFPTQGMRNHLQAGVRSIPDMKKNFMLWKTLTSGEKTLELGLDDGQESAYLFVDSMIEFNDSPEAFDNALELWDQGKKRKREGLSNVWKEKIYDDKTGQEIMLKFFEDAYDEGQFDDGYFFSAEDSFRNERVRQEVQNRYMFIAKNQLEIGATPDQAAYNARRFIQSIGRVTDINGNKEAQFHLPPGSEKIEMGHLRDKAIGVKGGFEGLYGGNVPVDGKPTKIEFYATAKTETGIPVDKLDADKVRLYTPIEKERSRTKDGEIVFEVWYDGVPLNAETKKGIVPMVVSFSQDELISEEVKSKGKRDITSELSSERAELEKLMKEQTSREGADRTSGLYIYGTPNLDQKIMQTKNAISDLERQYFNSRENLQ